MTNNNILTFMNMTTYEVMTDKLDFLKHHFDEVEEALKAMQSLKDCIETFIEDFTELSGEETNDLAMEIDDNQYILSRFFGNYVWRSLWKAIEDLDSINNGTGYDEDIDLSIVDKYGHEVSIGEWTTL